MDKVTEEEVGEAQEMKIEAGVGDTSSLQNFGSPKVNSFYPYVENLI